MGESHSWTWSGLMWARVEGAGVTPGAKGVCEQDQAAVSGDYTVNVSHALTTRIDTQFGANDTFVGPTITVTKTFVYPAAARVELVAN